VQRLLRSQPDDPQVELKLALMTGCGPTRQTESDALSLIARAEKQDPGDPNNVWALAVIYYLSYDKWHELSDANSALAEFQNYVDHTSTFDDYHDSAKQLIASLKERIADQEAGKSP
jgi:hypothetical protein